MSTNVHVCKELIEKIRKGEIKNHGQLEKEKTKTAGKYNVNGVIKNADLISFVNTFYKNDKYYKKLIKFLKTKPVRTASGVANIAVMWLPHKDAKGVSRSHESMSCPGKCIYCPQGENSPKSYTGVEPATMRAMRADYDPYMQVKTRLRQLSIIGHPTDKCELIIMGGTFMSAKKSFQISFIKECFDALNERKNRSLEDAQKLNEKAKHRCVGLTIETRADYCGKGEIEQMLKLGCTRVELGVQTTDDEILSKIKRGYLSETNKEAIRLLKQSGLKVCIHWMPGLTGLSGKIDFDKELRMFKELFKNPEYCPDELKIYPTLVIPGTKLYDLWKNGDYDSMTTEKMIGLLIEMKRIIPRYVRIKRIMRDISHKEVCAGPSATNLRQKTLERMEKEKIICNCIRCREIRNKKSEKVTLNKIEYTASGGKEIFLSFEDIKNNLLLAFLRLRIDDNIALIRELHVYGPMIPIGKKSEHTQHKGYGKKLLKEAENIAKGQKIRKIQVTSGIGVRDYYRKLGYKLEGYYMVKKIISSRSLR